MSIAEPVKAGRLRSSEWEGGGGTPRRILFVAHSAAQGGAELCLDTTLRHLDRSRIQATVVFAWDGPMAESARQMGYPVQVMSLSWWLYIDASAWYFKNLLVGAWPRIRRLAKFIRDEQIELVYTNTSAVFEGAVAARLAGVPHVWHVHEVLSPRGGLRSLVPVAWIQRFIRRHTTLAVFESDAARRVFEATTPLQNSTVVPNSLRFDPEDAAISSAEARQRLGLPRGAWIVGFVGQLIDRKNPRLLVDAFARMKRCDNALLLIAGDGPLSVDIIKRIESHGLRDNVRLLPFQDDPRMVMSAIDVLALPSRQESFGLVLVEAGSFGKPAVACRSQGPEEIVVDGETGLLVPQEDSGAMASALELLQDSPDLSAQMGAAARLHVVERFSPGPNTMQLEDHLAAILPQR